MCHFRQMAFTFAGAPQQRTTSTASASTSSSRVRSRRRQKLLGNGKEGRRNRPSKGPSALQVTGVTTHTPQSLKQFKIAVPCPILRALRQLWRGTSTETIDTPRSGWRDQVARRARYCGFSPPRRQPQFVAESFWRPARSGTRRHTLSRGLRGLLLPTPCGKSHACRSGDAGTRRTFAVLA
jgi:hypothetical protein